MTEDYFDKIHNSDSAAPFRYAESFNRYQIQLPLGIAWPVTTGSLSSDNLYDDRTDNWLFYDAGSHKTAIYSDVSERFGGLTITVYSGSTNVYVQLSEYLADTNPAFISAPYTVSGENQNNDLLLASYSADTPENPEAYWISLPEPGTYKISFPFPVVANAITVTHSGSSAYALSQILPRKTVQAFDLEVGSIKAYHVSASLIDTIALQVSDSIVVGPELIGAKSIDGSKIVDGTISGVLIRDGTIFANKIAAGTITATQIAVSGITADNLAARIITAEKIVLSGITAELIGAEAVTAAALASGAVVSGKLAADSVYASNIVGGQITAYHVAANTITGDRIQANTISGELITAGTITSTNIAVSGITADRLNVAQLDAVAAKMGTLVVNSGITVGENGYIWTGTGDVNTPTTGLKIYTTSGVSRLTTYNSGDAQIDIDTTGKLTAGAGAVILDSVGLTAGKTVVNSNGITIGDLTSLLNNNDALKIMVSGTTGNNGGISFYNGAYSSTSPQSAITTDATNNFVIANNAPDGNLIIGAADTGNNNIYLYNANVNIMPTVSGEVAGIFGYARDTGGIGEFIRYRLNVDGLYMYDDAYVAGEPVPNVILQRQTGNITTSGIISLSNGSASAPSLTFTDDPDTGFYSSGSNFIRVSTNGTQSAIFGPDRLLVSNGTVSSPALQFINDQNTGMYSVSADNLGFAAGGTQRLLLSSAGAGVTGKITSTEMGYLTVRRTADLAITTAGTTIVWQSVTRSGNISVSSDTITIDNAGYYTFSATFATLANLTSLRMTLVRGTINYVSTLHGAGLSTGGGYMFNFSAGFYAGAGTTYKIILTPSANTTLNANAEGLAGPSPILNIYQAIGV